MGHKRRPSTSSECGEAVVRMWRGRRWEMAPTVFTASRVPIGMPLKSPPAQLRVGTSGGYCGLQIVSTRHQARVSTPPTLQGVSKKSEFSANQLWQI